MAETEVESILREIRERVISEQRTGKESGVTRSAPTNAGNGARDAETLQQTNNHETLTAQNLALIESHLTTTARAWDRLPPLLSNRSGFIARVELWLKRQLKRATHWYTWEQVNFNASVHHALRDLHTVLSAHEQELRKLRAQNAEATARQTELDQYQATQLTELRRDHEAERDTQRNQVAALLNELRERDERLRDEQRVCFKQLALETSEAAVLEDRARRKADALLEELQRRVDQLETEKSDES
jgi:hypothetical protein